MHATISFYVAVGQEQYMYDRDFTTPKYPESLLRDVLKSYITEDFGVSVEDCSISLRDLDTDNHVDVLIKRNYKGKITPESFLKLDKPGYFVEDPEEDPEGHQMEDDDSDPEEDNDSDWETVYSDNEDYSDTEMEVDTESEAEAEVGSEADTDPEDSEDELVINLVSKKRKVVDDDSDAEPAVPTPVSKKRRVQAGSAVTQKMAVFNALKTIGRPATVREIFEHFVDNGLLQVFAVGDDRPEAISENHFVTEENKEKEYRARMGCSLKGLEDSGDVIVDRTGINVYWLA